MSDRASRRHHLERLKTKRFKQLKESRRDGDTLHTHHKVVGKAVRTPKICSTACCGNPRKYFNEKTKQEIQQEQAYK